MKHPTQNLAAKRDKLKVSAKAAAKLAAAERLLADQQHAVARELEILAEGLSDQVVAVEAEIEQVPSPVASNEQTQPTTAAPPRSDSSRR